MNTPNLKFKLVAVLLSSCLALASCSGGGSSRKKTELQGQSSEPVDFAGSWELDYSQSDNIQTKLDSMARELRRDAERRAQGSNQGAISVGGSGYNSAPSVIGLARMSDLITRSPLLKIEQSDHEIKVKREENFALGCEFYAGQYSSIETPLGTEICGWNGRQMVFKILLPEGLSIQHVMTLASYGGKLNIATTVVSDQVSYPFTLNRVYNRFVPGASGYSCTVTLTKGKVCTTKAK